MGFRPEQSGNACVSPSDFEALLAAAAPKGETPAEGLFGPTSISWKINRESALFLGAGRAALLQLAHPWVAAALQQHSNLLARPIARFHNTFRIVFTMVFGSAAQALTAARGLYALHATIRGELAEDIAGWRRGSHYEANEIAALRWVYATLVDSAVLAYGCVLPTLTDTERQCYYHESKTLAALFGIPPHALPNDWSELSAYVAEMCASDHLGVTASARAMAHNLLAGAGSWAHPPHWYRALTAAWMPARLRSQFALEFGDPDRRLADRATARLRAIYPRLPSSIRLVGPWHEACARIDSRPVPALARLSNQFWIGQPRLPFAGNSVLREQAQQTTIAK